MKLGLHQTVNVDVV